MADAPAAETSAVDPSVALVGPPTVFHVNLDESWLDIMDAEFDLSSFDFPSLLPRRLSSWSSFAAELRILLSPRELRLPDVCPSPSGPAPPWWDTPRGPTILLTFCLKRMLAASAFGERLQLLWYNALNLAGVHHDESWLVWAGTAVPPPSPDTITAFARQ